MKSHRHVTLSLLLGSRKAMDHAAQANSSKKTIAIFFGQYYSIPGCFVLGANVNGPDIFLNRALCNLVKVIFERFKLEVAVGINHRAIVAYLGKRKKRAVW